MMWSVSALFVCLSLGYAAQAYTFVAPASGPTDASSNYVGSSNVTLPKPTVVPGKAFDRFIQIWLENTDFDTASGSSTFSSLAKQGILLDQYYALTHPSEPNYIAAVGGDFWGLGDDNFYAIPSNISTVVDLLEAKNISWVNYQENEPTDGFTGFNFSSKNYINTTEPPYTFYVRKHNPLIIYDSVATDSKRAALQRNFNDFAADINASAIPQWVWVTPNMVNDAHDTDIDFLSSWIQYWLLPLLNDTRFNDGKTLILLTFDENESYPEPNRVFGLLLGGAVPDSLKGTTDSTFYTHYSSLSTVEANWGLGSLGRGDTNETLSNVFGFVASATGYTNNQLSGASIPLTNLTGIFPGPLNGKQYVPYTAPNTSAVGAGGGPVFVAPNLNTSLTAANAPAPVNLTASNKTVPGSINTDTSANSSSAAPAAQKSNGAASVGGQMVLTTSAVLAIVMGYAMSM